MRNSIFFRWGEKKFDMQNGRVFGLRWGTTLSIKHTEGLFICKVSLAAKFYPMIGKLGQGFALPGQKFDAIEQNR